MPISITMVDAANYYWVLSQALMWAKNKPFHISSLGIDKILDVVIYSGSEVTDIGHITGGQITRAFIVKDGITVGFDRCFPNLAGVNVHTDSKVIKAMLVKAISFGQELWLAVTKDEVYEVFR